MVWLYKYFFNIHWLKYSTHCRLCPSVRQKFSHRILFNFFLITFNIFTDAFTRKRTGEKCRFTIDNLYCIIETNNLNAFIPHISVNLSSKHIMFQRRALYIWFFPHMLFCVYKAWRSFNESKCRWSRKRF